MRYSDIIEDVAFPASMTGTKFYHGSASVIYARKIMKNGIQPPEITTNTNMSPVKGKVYITPSLDYAVTYAVGGVFFDNELYRVPYKTNIDTFRHMFSDDKNSKHYGRYGYLFVISGDELNLVQPDEDSIGELLSEILNNGSGVEYYSSSMTGAYKKALADTYLTQEIRRIATRKYSPKTLNRIKDGDYGWIARVGKGIVKELSDISKAKMVEYGFHIAHTGAIIPDEVWKIDKTKVGWIKKDCSNFFEIAKRVR